MLHRVAKRSCGHNRLIVRPLWSVRTATQHLIEKDFSLSAPPGAIIEHEHKMARGRLFQPRAIGSIRSSPATYLAVQTCRANKYEASMDAAWQVIANAGPPRPVPWH